MVELLARYTLREKLIVGFGLAILIVIVLHAQVIEPYQLRSAELEDEIEQQRSDLEWMRSAVAALPANGSVAPAATIDGTLASFVDEVVRRQGISGQLSQMSPVGEDELRLRYSAVNFNRLVNFIAEVNARGLEIKDIRVTTGDNVGVVNCSLVLIRS